MVYTSDFDPVGATLQEVVDRLQQGSLTSVKLLHIYLKAIEKDNHQGLNLRAVLELVPVERLRKIAHELDEEREAGQIRGLLHGVPILIKDSIAVHPAMGLQTTSGTSALIGYEPRQNAAVVDNLIKAGAIILGKANMTVLSNLSGLDMSGWSPRGGQTPNIFNPATGHPGGSSTGSAVAVAAGFCAAAVGVETCGSIMSPSMRAGVFGFKPVPGLVPRQGLMHGSLRQDSIGPMGKSAWDLAALLTGMTGSGINYTREVDIPSSDIASYSFGISRVSHKKTKDKSPEKLALEAEGRKFLDEITKRLGFAVKDDNFDCEGFRRLLAVDPMESWGWDENGKWSENHNGHLILIHDIKKAFDDYAATTSGDDIQTLEDLVQWNKDHPDIAFREDRRDDPMTQRLLELSIEANQRPKKDEEYQAILKDINHIADEIMAAFDEKKLDVVLFGPENLTGSRADWYAASTLLPIATLPAGMLSNGEPFHLLIVGRKNNNKTVLGVVAALEKILPPRPIARSVSGEEGE